MDANPCQILSRSCCRQGGNNLSQWSLPPTKENSVHICEVALRGCCWLGGCEDTVMNTTGFPISCAEVFFSLLVYSGLNCLISELCSGRSFVCLFPFLMCFLFRCISSISSSWWNLSAPFPGLYGFPCLPCHGHGDTVLSCPVPYFMGSRLMQLKGSLFLLCRQQTFRFSWLNWRFLSHFYVKRKDHVRKRSC